MEGSSSKDVKHVHFSYDIPTPVTFKVESLEGQLYPPSSGTSTELFSTRKERKPAWFPPELYVECMLYIDGEPFGPAMRTKHHPMPSTSCKWGEKVSMLAKYRDLTANAQIGFTVWDWVAADKAPVGGATIRLFSKGKLLKWGEQKLRLWRGLRADGKVPTTTPGKVPKGERGEKERLEALASRYDQGGIPRVSWLDRATFRAMEARKQELSAEEETSYLYLTVDLQKFEYPVQFQEVPVSQLVQVLPLNNAFVRVPDPEIGLVIPSENKQVKLARSGRGVIDRGIKPNLEERKQIASILARPSTRNLTLEERQLLWEFRMSLKSDKNALTKFLACVDWLDTKEANEAIDLMHHWVKIDVPDGLQLLTPDFKVAEVRRYAISVLETADDDELLHYLLQLVQALRYERSDDSALGEFLVQRALKNFEFSIFLHWYLMVGWQDFEYGKRFMHVDTMLLTRLTQSKEGKETLDRIKRQEGLRAQLTMIVMELQKHRSVQRKQEKLRALLHSQSIIRTHFEHEIQLFLDPRVSLTGVVAKECHVFKSALAPLLLTFSTAKGGKCKVIYKTGDNLCQDQLVIQILSLMDRLLKRENLDLKLTPYRVLAMDNNTGLLEFVPSSALAHIIADRTIIKFLQQHHPDSSGPFGITAECLETFIKSCAGYCVIMYILGVGDRHLDNLLMASDGRIFHIDFGYILGHDPKPFPPPMKLCKEMVEAMGGTDSAHFKRFKGYCCEAYNILRKSSQLIISLFELMAGAKIPDMTADPRTSILKLEEKFRLDLDDEGAVQFFQSLINESVSALFPQVVEVVHRWAQYWR